MSRGRILIVEDEYLVAADVEAALEERGFMTVGIAPDTESALQLAAAQPDVALVDVHLRDGATGPDIAERLARDYQIPVLFMTANPNIVGGSAAAGVLGVLGKPCGEETISAAIDYVMTQRTNPQAAPPAGLQLFG